MSYLIHYGIHSLICLNVLYVIFYISFRKHKLFIINRLYLIGSLLFILFLPLARQFTPSLSPLLPSAFVLPEIQFTNSPIMDDSSLQLMTLPQFLMIAYILISFVFFIRLVIKLISLYRFIQTGVNIKKENGINYILHQQNISAFSFFNYLVINESVYNSSDAHLIIDHELIHIRQLHSLDVLISELSLVIHWFNPAAWLINRSMIENHEYLADNQVLKSGKTSISQYQHLIVSHIPSIQLHTLANQFNTSLLKNRFNMMKTTTSKRTYVLRALLSLPVLYFTLVSYAGNNQPAQEAPTSPVSDIQSNFVQGDDSVFYVVEVMPQYGNGGDEGVKQHIAQNLIYPEKARKDGAICKVFVEFTINEKGLVQDVMIKKATATIFDPTQEKDVPYSSEEFEKESLRVVKSLGIFTPGMQKGIPVKVKMVLPINYKLN